jgi:hypothetical protein
MKLKEYLMTFEWISNKEKEFLKDIGKTYVRWGRGMQEGAKFLGKQVADMYGKTNTPVRAGSLVLLTAAATLGAVELFSEDPKEKRMHVRYRVEHAPRGNSTYESDYVTLEEYRRLRLNRYITILNE